MGHAAQALGISERVMGLRMRKFGLGYKAFRQGAPWIRLEWTEIMDEACLTGVS